MHMQSAIDADIDKNVSDERGIKRVRLVDFVFHKIHGTCSFHSMTSEIKLNILIANL